MKKVAFVVPWYGEKIPGGAEDACRELAKHLKQDGVDMEILTTCVREFASDWGRNVYKPGTETVGGIPVRRFRAASRDRTAFDRVNAALMRGQPVRRQEEEIFFREMVHSPDLTRYIREHASDYHCFIHIPYLFGTAYYGIPACPEKSILIPCLHDESYAHLDGIRRIFGQVHGLIFLSRPEATLAERLYSIEGKKRQVIGLGIRQDYSADPRHFFRKYKLKHPFLLYAGRKDAGKNVPLLLQYFGEFLSEHPDCPLDLVLIGGGEIGIPASCRGRVRDLGFVPIQDKYNACSAALALCQPSFNESFSIVIMESWIGRRPVLANSKCAVTRDFCVQSNGGLYFDGYREFEGCLEYLMDHRETADQLGRQGRRFVGENFAWDVVTGRYRKFIEELYT